MNFLIVDDNQNNRILMQKILSLYGDCDLAVDGKEAFDAFKIALKDGTPYDLICLDIMMPVMNGQEVLKAIRDYEAEYGIQREKGVKIVMVTALNTPKDMIEAFFIGGCNDYIAKPVKRGDLVEILARYDMEPIKE